MTKYRHLIYFNGFYLEIYSPNNVNTYLYFIVLFYAQPTQYRRVINLPWTLFIYGQHNIVVLLYCVWFSLCRESVVRIWLLSPLIYLMLGIFK